MLGEIKKAALGLKGKGGQKETLKKQMVLLSERSYVIC
jgi:hypothetical protein